MVSAVQTSHESAGVTDRAFRGGKQLRRREEAGVSGGRLYMCMQKFRYNCMQTALSICEAGWLATPTWAEKSRKQCPGPCLTPGRTGGTVPRLAGRCGESRDTPGKMRRIFGRPTKKMRRIFFWLAAHLLTEGKTRH